MSKDFRKYTLPPQTYGQTKEREKKTLLVDLDCTLIYTFSQPPPDFFRLPDAFTFEIPESDGSRSPYYVLVRPHAREFVTECLRYYNIGIFTSATQDYADEIIQRICPQVELRLYRQHCQEHIADGRSVYYKDMRVLPNCPFSEKSTILFDDWAPENTIPQENGMLCSAFEPNRFEFNPHEMVEERDLLTFSRLLCRPLFYDAEDIRIPIDAHRRAMEDVN